MYRKGTIDDCKRVYDLICDMEKKQLPYNKFSTIYQDQVQNEHFYCLLYECDNAVQGVLNLRFEAQLHHSEIIAEIMEFAVDSTCRSQGIGKRMLKRACEVAVDYGCSQIEVACNQLRKDTHRFYLREGMHQFHYKFSMPLTGEDVTNNALGR